MKKLIQFALSAAFPNSNTEGLLEVINSTANPDIATEMILGIYEKPELQPTLLQRRDTQINLEITNVDHIRQRVDYSYNYKETIYTIKNKDGKLVESTTSTYAKNKYIKLDEGYTVETKVTIEEEKRKDYMDIDQWIELQQKSTNEVLVAQAIEE